MTSGESETAIVLIDNFTRSVPDMKKLFYLLIWVHWRKIYLNLELDAQKIRTTKTMFQQEWLLMLQIRYY